MLFLALLYNCPPVRGSTCPLIKAAPGDRKKLTV
jgi:hypothetical protein